MVRAALYAGITTTAFWPAITPLRSWKVRRQRQIAHRVETGRRGQDFGNRVDDNRCRRNVAVDPARDFHRKTRRSLDVHRIVRLRRAEIRLHMEPKDGLALTIADAVLN